MDAVIMRTSPNYYGFALFEIMSEVWLRQTIAITDGDVVLVEVFT